MSRFLYYFGTLLYYCCILPFTHKVSPLADFFLKSLFDSVSLHPCFIYYELVLIKLIHNMILFLVLYNYGRRNILFKAVANTVRRNFAELYSFLQEPERIFAQKAVVER